MFAQHLRASTGRYRRCLSRAFELIRFFSGSVLSRVEGITPTRGQLGFCVSKQRTAQSHMDGRLCRAAVIAKHDRDQERRAVQGADLRRAVAQTQTMRHRRSGSPRRGANMRKYILYSGFAWRVSGAIGRVIQPATHRFFRPLGRLKIQPKGGACSTCRCGAR